MNWQKGDKARVCSKIHGFKIGDIVTIEKPYPSSDWIVKDKNNELVCVFDEDIEPCNFFWLDEFYETLDDFTEDIDLNDLPNSWTNDIELSELLPAIDVDMDDIKTMVSSNYFQIVQFKITTEQFEQIDAAFESAIDFEKLNAAIPKLYFPNGQIRTLTKKDLTK